MRTNFAILIVSLIAVGLSSSAWPAEKEIKEIILKGPEGLTYDAKDNLVVADTGNNRVLVFDPSLKLIMKIENKEGVDIGQPGQLNKPSDVGVDSKGRFIVSERGNHRVQIFSPNGDFIMAIGKKTEDPDTNKRRQSAAEGEFNTPTHVTIDDRDNIIITERWNHRIQVFDKNGKHLFTLANRTGERPKEMNEEIQKNAKRPEDLKADWREWKKTDPGHMNEPGGTFYDRELKRLYLGNGWNCRIEAFDYDTRNGKITRRPEEKGIIWGFWTIRSVTGDSQGRLIGTDSNFANLGIFDDRANLTNTSKRSTTVNGGSYGKMEGVWDVAVNSKDDVAVADTANSRVVIFDKDFKIPEDPRVIETTSHSAEITWDTTVPAPTKLRLLKTKYPMQTKGLENEWINNKENVRELTESKKRKTEHKIDLSKLQPGTRYFYKIHVPGKRTIPGSGWSREYALGTSSKKGEKAYLSMPIKIFLKCNVIDAASVKPDTSRPEPMPDEEITLYRRDLDEARLFYWNNSSMQYLIDYDLYIDDTIYRVGKMPEDAPDWLRELPERGKNENELIEESDNKEKIYFGVVSIEAKRAWNADRKNWSYQGSGGGTHGIKWPGLGSSHFLGGSDIAWLMCHEYHHQVESQYGESGLSKDDDRMIFCHFAPVHKGWKWSTAYDHGEHWDGIAWSFREFTTSQYLRCKYGEIKTTRDTDGDGIPDDDPSLPMDEKRFGSDPKKIDTDRDGLNDMEEILASKWVTCLNAGLRTKISAGYIRPDPKNKDSDGDGIEDGKDKYPIYPFKPVINEAKIKVDGDLADWPEDPQLWMDSHGLKLNGWTGHDEEWLYYAFSIEGDFSEMKVVLDCDADGFYVGVDNIYTWIQSDAKSGPKLRDVKLHICGNEGWPHFDKKQEETGKYKYINPDDLKFASAVKDGVQLFEVAVPKKPDIGLNIEKGEEIGLMIYITPKDKAHISLFEPWSIFDMTVQ